MATKQQTDLPTVKRSKLSKKSKNIIIGVSVSILIVAIVVVVLVATGIIGKKDDTKPDSKPDSGATACSPNPCKNGGKCVVTTNPTKGGSLFTCQCPDPFFGTTCTDQNTSTMLSMNLVQPANVPKNTVLTAAQADEFRKVILVRLKLQNDPKVSVTDIKIAASPTNPDMTTLQYTLNLGTPTTAQVMQSINTSVTDNSLNKAIKNTSLWTDLKLEVGYPYMYSCTSDAQSSKSCTLLPVDTSTEIGKNTVSYATEDACMCWKCVDVNGVKQPCARVTSITEKGDATSFDNCICKYKCS